MDEQEARWHAFGEVEGVCPGCSGVGSGDLVGCRLRGSGFGHEANLDISGGWVCRLGVGGIKGELRRIDYESMRGAVDACGLSPGLR